MTKPKPETRGRNKLPASFKQRRCCVFTEDQARLATAERDLRRVGRPLSQTVLIAHAIRHGLSEAIRELSGQPKMEEA